MRFVDRILPVAVFQNPRELRRARLIVWTCLTLFLSLGFTLGARITIAPLTPPQVVLAVLSLAVLALVPVVLRRTGSLVLAGWLTTCVFMVLMVTQAFWAGGIKAPVAALLPVVPLLATHLVGPGTGRWTIIMVGAVVLLMTFVLPLVWDIPIMPFEGNQEELARGLMILVALVLIGALTAGYENQRKALEQRLRQSDALYRRLFDQSKDMVALATPNGRLIDVNQAGVELFKFPSKEAFLQTDTRSLYVDPRQRDELIRRLERDGFVRGYESRQRARDGSLKTIQGTTTCVRNSKGDMTHFLTILRDVTEERELARERDLVMVELERKNRELEQFAYVISHDLKSPLITLRGFLDLMTEDVQEGDFSRVSEDLVPIIRTTEKMQAMVDDLLQLATIGADSSSWAEYSVTDLAEGVGEMLSGRIQEHGIQLKVAKDLPRVYTDPTLLRTLLQNLMDNAAKFLAGQPNPILEVGARLDDGNIVFFVRDNGPGIAKDDLEKIFGLFSKLETDVQGTGIGLALVRKVAGMLGGKVWAESEGVGHGATFCFTLPSSDSLTDA